jgi:N-acyl amino acid synthase of PEP-CTERM/exosortase system
MENCLIKLNVNTNVDKFLSRVEFGAHEETVDHINRKIYRSFHGERASQEAADIFKLRYQVYCIECAFLREDHYADEMEFDDYDKSSTHFAAYTLDENLIGTVRLVQPEYPQRFPFELHCQTFDGYQMPPRELCAEISRLAVRKSHRRRRADSVLGIPGFAVGHRHEGFELSPAVERRDRASPMLLLGMYREMFRYSRHAGVRYWYAAMERSLAFALSRMGFQFTPIGPQADYYGAVTPYALDLHELDERLHVTNPALASWFNEKPLVFTGGRSSHVHILREGSGSDIDHLGGVIAEAVRDDIR